MRFIARLCGVLVMAAPACSDTHPTPGSDATAEAGSGDGGTSGPSDAIGGADLAGLGSCASWSNWTTAKLAGIVCEHKCDKYVVQCTSGAKGEVCACTAQLPTGGVGYHICKQRSTGDPDDCRRSFFAGCCTQMAK